jgi:hypothetical protein
VSFPLPQPGLVIRYSYLWKRESDLGRDEGVKDRPCAIIVALEDVDGRARVFVLPITHSEPKPPTIGIEIPRLLAARLRLDSELSWVIVSELNSFSWPGPDLRPIPGQDMESIAYGFLPPRFFRIIRDAYLALDAERRVFVVPRTE